MQFVIQQLWRLIINAQQDVREDYDIQNLLHVVMNMVPRLMVRLTTARILTCTHAHARILLAISRAMHGHVMCIRSIVCVCVCMMHLWMRVACMCACC